MYLRLNFSLVPVSKVAALRISTSNKGEQTQPAGFILTLCVLELIHIHFHDKESAPRLQFSTLQLSLGEGRWGSRLFKSPFSKQEFGGPRRKNIGLCMRLTSGSLFLGTRKVRLQLGNSTPVLTLRKPMLWE